MTIYIIICLFLFFFNTFPLIYKFFFKVCETIGGVVDEIYARIFDKCKACCKRIPVVPATLDNRSGSSMMTTGSSQMFNGSTVYNNSGFRRGSGSDQCTRTSGFEGGSGPHGNVSHGLHLNASHYNQLFAVLIAVLDAGHISPTELVLAFALHSEF